MLNPSKTLQQISLKFGLNTLQKGSFFPPPHLWSLSTIWFRKSEQENPC